MVGAILGAAATIGASALNNSMAAGRTEQDRRENYMYGEMAAENADRRTRRLYNDFYSPEALMRQYKAAGLSPSMMFGGTPGQGGMSGAQGGGAAGLQTPYMPISMVEAAQAANLMADTEKKKAETANIEENTDLTKLQTEAKKFENSYMETEWNILTSTWTNPNTGEATSLFEMARMSWTFEDFVKDIRYRGKNGEIDDTLYQETQSEAGMKILRGIYTAANKFHTDIMTLSAEAVDAQFELSVQKALLDHNFAEMNAVTAIKILQQEAATNELTTQQKQAWDNLLKGIEKMAGTSGKDVAIILGMVISSFMKNTSVKINTGK